jgi:hypothetical protein
MLCISGQEKAMTAPAIAGGFIPVPVASLLVAWRSASVGDFRVWLASWETRARRQGLGEARSPHYSIAELAGLVGISERRVRSSLRRLAEAGLIEWTPGSIRFPDQILSPEDLVGDSIGGGKGSLMIPRRIVRFLANGARPALIATVLGTLFRCLSRRGGGFDGRGRVKASWIARAFGIDVRSIKAARSELVRLGWISIEDGDRQSAMNRWGRACRIDLGWSLPDCRQSPPLDRAGLSPITTPSVNQEPPWEKIQHQEPASGRPVQTGIQLSDSGQGSTASGLILPAPILADIRREDLADVGRTLKLLDQAVAKGLVGTSEHDRLRFVALAVHCLAIGQKPGGLFMALLRRGAWEFVTQGEEDAARRLLKNNARSVPAPQIPVRRSNFTPGDPMEDRRSAMLRELAAWKARN